MHARRIAPVVVLLVPGCFSSLVDLEGIEGEADTGPAAADASADAVEASADASTSDGSADDTAVSDAPDDAPPVDATGEDGPVLGWCESQGPSAVFCDDFDQAILWDDEIVSPKASLGVSTSQASSAPRSLAFSVEPVTQSGQGEAYRRKQLPALAGSFSFSLQVWLEEVPVDQGEMIPVQLVLEDGSDLTLRLSILAETPYGTQLEVETIDQGQKSYDHYGLVSDVALGKWVRLAYRVSAAPRKLSLYADGEPMLQDLALASLGDGEIAPEIRVGGCYVSAPSEAWKVYYDNVLVD